MFLTQRVANAFGFISFAILLIISFLQLTHNMPEYLFLPVFFLALALFLTRITIRMLIARKERIDLEKKDTTVKWEKEGPDDTSSGPGE